MNCNSRNADGLAQNNVGMHSIDNFDNESKSIKINKSSFINVLNDFRNSHSDISLRSPPNEIGKLV